VNNACDLAKKECIPCKGGIPALKGADLQKLAAQLPGWEVVNEHHLRRTFKFRNFVEALAFVNRIGELAERVGHHPDLQLSWGRVTVEIWTHKIDGLAEADFIFAAKVDTFFSSMSCSQLNPIT
jgi:4a-hydroxytetrahydrobiopterin dehydratase